MIEDIGIIRRIRRIQRIMFSGNIEKYLKVNQRHKVADNADDCGYRDHPADPADPADPANHVFRKHRKISKSQSVT